MAKVLTFLTETLFQKIQIHFIWKWRVMIGICYFLIGLHCLIDNDVFYGQDGIIFNLTAKSSLFFDFIFFCGRNNLIQYLWCILILSSLFVIIGFYSRFFLAICIILHTGLLNIYPYIFEGANVTIKNYAFIMLFLPLDSKFSIIKSTKKVKSEIWVLLALRLLVITTYLTPSLTRIKNQTHSDSFWILHPLVENTWTRLPYQELLLSLNEKLLGFATLTIILIELLSSVFLILKKTRKAYTYILISLHCSLLIFTKIWLWQLLMISFLTLFLIDLNKYKINKPDIA